MVASVVIYVVSTSHIFSIDNIDLFRPNWESFCKNIQDSSSISVSKQILLPTSRGRALSALTSFEALDQALNYSRAVSEAREVDIFCFDN